MFDVVSSFTNWVKRPYSDEMDVIGWVLFIGLLILILAGWRLVINKIA